jgi:Cap4 dsDNA endonuclease
MVRDDSDPGDATARNYRYQHAYGVILLVAAKRGLKPYVAVWCEHHEDFLAERDDGLFDAYQIKTSRPERGGWRLTDDDLTKSISRFIDLVNAFGERIGDLFFVSNTEFDEVTPESKDTKRRGRCPRLFLLHVRGCATRSEIAAPFDDAFDRLMATCGCDADQLFSVLKRMNLVVGPTRNDFDASLSHEHIARLDDCRALNAAQLDSLRDELVAVVCRASSLHVTDPVRHLRSLIEPREDDPVLIAKRLVVAETVVCQPPAALAIPFRFAGEPTLTLGSGLATNTIDLKLTDGGLADQIEYMRQRALGSEYTLMEDAIQRPAAFPELLQQIEQRVHGELCEAYLHARQRPAPYGAAMLIDVQARLRRLAEHHASEVGGHSYDCLIGVAGLLTDECRTWWGPRFPIQTGGAV